MKKSLLIVIIATLVGGSTVSQAKDVATAQTSSEWITQAEDHLSEGKFTAALGSYAEAVSLEPDNDEIKQKYSLLRQVIRVREMHDVEKDPARKLQMAAALRSYFYDHALHQEAFKIDRETFHDVQSTEAAADLAESQLELERNSETIELLSSLPQEHQSLRTQTLLSIALLREGKMEDAKALVDTLQRLDSVDHGLLFEQACMYSLLGSADKASTMLTQSFQMTLPSQLDKAHARAMAREDLQLLQKNGAMKKLLMVKSKVAESSCSSKASCAGCPSAGNCSSSGSSAEKDSGCDDHDKK